MITSRRNEFIRETAKLKQKKYRDERGLFLADGRKLYEEARDSGLLFDTIFITQALYDAFLRDGEMFAGVKEPVLVTPEVLEVLSGVKQSDGIVSVLKLPKSTLRTISSCVVLEEVRDPGNLGTIIRTADAAGYDAVLCSPGCADLYNEKTLRASMGSLFHLPVVKTEDIGEAIQKLKEDGFTVIGTSLEGEPLNLRAPQDCSKPALVFGSESHGMTEYVQSLCDRLVKIPIYGKAESLNVAAAAGVLLYAFTNA